MQTSGDNKTFWFPEWRRELAGGPLLRTDDRGRFETAIVRYQTFLMKRTRQPGHVIASVALKLEQEPAVVTPMSCTALNKRPRSERYGAPKLRQAPA
ncbi:MAG: hypothetical protein GXP31_03810 [Kiritimatiellaeota bacterium]|nr:hypothetical protein [Kiritimatiellota bacterium]